MPERESEDPEFSAPPVPTPPPADPLEPEKPKKQPKQPKTPKAQPKVEPDADDESENGETSAKAEDSKPKAGERGHPQVGDAEPLPPTPSIGAEEQADLITAQRAKKHGIRLRKALKEFPEIQDILDDNEALKARLAELAK